jgi:Protein of unknown function (DUF3313)
VLMKRVSAIIAGLSLGMLNVTLQAAPRLQTGPDAEVTYDGLHRVDKTVMSAAWVKPDLDLRGYDKLMLVGAGFSYKAVDNQGKRYVPGRSNDTEFYITERNRERVEREMREAFLKSLEGLQRYELVTQPGPGTLALVAGAYDIVSSVPPTNTCTGRCDVYLRQVGEATLVVELRDSLSNEVLARAADRRAAESAGWPINANSVTVWPEVRRLASFWGTRVRKALDDFQSVDDIAPRR